MDRPTLDRRLEDLAPLAEPMRRALYLHVLGAPEPVGRDDAAAALGIGRPLAAFHLDRLVDEGLLATEFRRRSGRTGPGAGRPAKFYRRGAGQIDVSLPERRDDLLARLFAEALQRGRDEAGGPDDALEDAARRYGLDLGREARRRAGSRPSRARLLAEALAVLAEQGFEPVDSGDVVSLRNCPFDRLARDYRPLVCGTNTTLMTGLVSGLRLGGVTARFDPEPGRCCVVLEPTAAGRAGRSGRVQGTGQPA